MSQRAEALKRLSSQLQIQINAKEERIRQLRAEQSEILETFIAGALGASEHPVHDKLDGFNMDEFTEFLFSK